MFIKRKRKSPRFRRLSSLSLKYHARIVHQLKIHQYHWYYEAHCKNKSAFDKAKLFVKKLVVPFDNAFHFRTSFHRNHVLEAKNKERRFGISAYTPHDFRDTCATEWRKNGMSLDMIARLLGHAKTETTEKRYVKYNEEVLSGVREMM